MFFVIKDIFGFIKDLIMKDRIYIVVFVIDSSNVDVMLDGIVKKLKDIKEMFIDRGYIFNYIE